MSTELIAGRYTSDQLLAGARALKSEDVISGAVTPKAAFCAAAGIDERTFVPPNFVHMLLENASKPERDKREYRAAVMALPEAAEHPKAVARVLEMHAKSPMPLHRVQALLASFPSEAAERRAVEDQAAQARQALSESTGPGPTLKRRVEIRMSALSMRADRGDQGARSELSKLQYAMNIVAQSPSTPLSRALAMADVDVNSIK